MAGHSLDDKLQSFLVFSSVAASRGSANQAAELWKMEMCLVFFKGQNKQQTTNNNHQQKTTTSSSATNLFWPNVDEMTTTPGVVLPSWRFGLSAIPQFDIMAPSAWSYGVLGAFGLMVLCPLVAILSQKTMDLKIIPHTSG